MKDLDLARLFENAFPSTTDTTIKFHTNGKDGMARKPPAAILGLPTEATTRMPGRAPHSFIITGDIIAEWLRDSTNQLRPYQPLAKKDRRIFDLILGAINTQSEYVISRRTAMPSSRRPYRACPATSTARMTWCILSTSPASCSGVQYELDSLGHFLALANDFTSTWGARTL